MNWKFSLENQYQSMPEIIKKLLAACFGVARSRHELFL